MMMQTRTSQLSLGLLFHVLVLHVHSYAGEVLKISNCMRTNWTTEKYASPCTKQQTYTVTCPCENGILSFHSAETFYGAGRLDSDFRLIFVCKLQAHALIEKCTGTSFSCSFSPDHCQRNLTCTNEDSESQDLVNLLHVKYRCSCKCNPANSITEKPSANTFYHHVSHVYGISKELLAVILSCLGIFLLALIVCVIWLYKRYRRGNQVTIASPSVSTDTGEYETMGGDHGNRSSAVSNASYEVQLPPLPDRNRNSDPGQETVQNRNSRSIDTAGSEGSLRSSRSLSFGSGVNISVGSRPISLTSLSLYDKTQSSSLADIDL